MNSIGGEIKGKHIKLLKQGKFPGAPSMDHLIENCLHEKGKQWQE